MAETPEPLAAILAEMRADVADGENAFFIRADWLALCDRIEAAAEREFAERGHREYDHGYATGVRHGREDNAPVNAAAMREALEKIADMKFHLGDFAEPVGGDSSAIYENAKWDGKKFLGRELPAWWGAGWRESLSRAIDIVRSALAAPARNCDVVREENEALYRCRANVPVERDAAYDRGMRDAIRWFFAPAEGGAE